MKLSTRALICVLSSLAITACTWRNDPLPQYARIMRHFEASVAPKYYVQIAGAISISPRLRDELNELADSGKFTGFIVNDRSKIANGKVTLFGGFTQGTKIVLTTEYLQVLLKSRYTNIAHDKSMKADNTVFALAHLVHHLQMSVNPEQYDTPENYNKAKLRDEAAAFIEGWNAMLDVARTQNRGKNLTAAQISGLLSNTRYNFAFQGLQNWNRDGTIREDADSLEHIEQTLGHSSIEDIE